MDWKRSALGHVLTIGKDVWRIRGPIFGKSMYWVYFNHSRYNETGSYEDSIRFGTLRAAKRFVERVVNAKNGVSR